MARPIVLLGSSRGKGETRRAVDLAFADKADCVTLQDYAISPYDYEHANRDDDFLSVVDLMLVRDTLVFATPVYWYSMSALMKIFFDRLSDLVTTEKPKGRALAGKNAWLIASGTENQMPEGFDIPFARTFNYFDMRYGGACYLYTDDNPALRAATEAQVREFGVKILNSEG